MFGEHFIRFLIIYFLGWLIIRSIAILRNKRRIRWKEETILLVFVLYLFAVFYVTMEPFNFQLPIIGPRAFTFDHQLFYQLSQMAEGHYYLKSLYVFGNILLLFPFGLLAPFIFKNMRHFLKLVMTSFVISLSIEMIQGLFTLTRRATLDDLVLNTFGAILGYLVFRYIRKYNKA